MFLYILLALIVIGVGIYLYYASSSSEKEPESGDSDSDSLPTVKPEDLPDYKEESLDEIISPPPAGPPSDGGPPPETTGPVPSTPPSSSAPSPPPLPPPTRYPPQPEAEPPPTSENGYLDVSPPECIKGSWSEWSLCDKECGGGHQYRQRDLSGSCPGSVPKKETRTCNTHSCKQDCVLSEWSPWSDCSKACDRGKRTRTRTIVTHPKYDGKPCLHLIEEEECNAQACPIDCEVSAWSEWTDCSKSCGGGIQERTRTVTKHPKFGGKICPLLREEKRCNQHLCPVDCVISDWGPWSECVGLSPDACGKGTQTRRRQIINEATLGGKPCETDPNYFFESRECPLPACMVADTPWVSGSGGTLVSAQKCPTGHLTSLSVNYTPSNVGIYSIKGKCSDNTELKSVGSSVKGLEETIKFPEGIAMGLIHLTTSKLYQIHNKYFPSARTSQSGVMAKPLRCNEGKVAGYQVRKLGNYLSNIKFSCR